MTPFQQNKIPVLPCWYLLPQRQSDKAQPCWLGILLYLGRFSLSSLLSTFSWLLKPLTSPAAWLTKWSGVWEQAGQLSFHLLLPEKCAAPQEPWDGIQPLARVQRPSNSSTAPGDKADQDAVDTVWKGDLVKPGQLSGGLWGHWATKTSLHQSSHNPQWTVQAMNENPQIIKHHLL